jgi:hypothetical protein
VDAKETCTTSPYGVKTCKKEDVDLDVQKRVSRVGEVDRNQKITKVGKGEEFVFYIKVTNENDFDLEKVKIVDDLPSEMIRVSGLDSSETFNLKSGKSKTFEIKAKLRESEFLSNVNYEKCVVNKAVAFYDGKEKEDGTATVCYGNPGVLTMPKTGPSEYWLFYGLGLISLGVIVKGLVRLFSQRFRKI